MSKKRLLFLLLLFSLIVFGCSQSDIKKTAEERLVEGNYADKTTDNMVPGEYGEIERKIKDLENEFKIIRQNNYQASPEGYEQVKHRLEELESINDDRLRILRDEFSKMKVGGTEEHTAENTMQAQQQNFKMGLMAPRGCEGNGSFLLGTPPMALADIQKILPMGVMSSQHITPTDHQYFHTIGFAGPKEDMENLDRFKIYAPADGEIVSVGTLYGRNDYRIVIAHTCTFYTIFIHVDKLSNKVLAAILEKNGNPEMSWERIPVKEGEVIGTIGTGKLDFSVVDESVTLTGFARRDTYDNKEKGEIWKTHTVDTFDYYKEPVRSELLKKNLRKVEPFGGKIDFDIDGKIVGNWFVEGTGGYRGLGNWDYWLTHLSIVYDAFDPEHIAVSIGDFGGMGQQFGVTGNAPDPKDIGVGKLVKYELAVYEHYSGNAKWDGLNYAENIKARNTNEIRGTALFELIEPGRLKAEFFVGKRASEVNGFTGNAKVYER